MAPWKFTGSDQRFELDFEPLIDRQGATDFIVIKSVQHQDLGYFSGHVILDDGTRLGLAVKIEENGEAVYRRAISQSENQRLKELRLWIADEERDHSDWFRSLLEEMGKQPAPPQVKEMPRTIIDDLIGKQSFSLTGIDFSRIENSSDLIDIFIEFENDTILFYEMLKSFLTDTATIGHLEKIIREEASHVEKFEGLRSKRP